MRFHGFNSLLLVLAVLTASAGCSSGDGDPDGSVAPPTTSAYFAPDVDNPERSLIPMPNILAVDQEASPPTLSLRSSQCYEPGSSREATLVGLEALDGFGTYSDGSILTFFGAELDGASLSGRVLLVDMGTWGSEGADADPGNPIPVSLVLTASPKTLQGCDAGSVDVPTLVITPRSPDTGLPIVLKGDHQYAVALLTGIMDADGDPVLPHYVFTLLRAEEESEDITILQLQLMHKSMFQVFDSMGYAREDLLVAWTFKTVSTGTALEGIHRQLGVLGEEYDSTAVTVPADSMPVPPLPAEDFLNAIGLSCQAIGAGTDCPGIGSLLSGQFVSPRFQQLSHIPLPWVALDGGAQTVPGTFSDNRHPEVQGNQGDTLSFLASTPAGVGGPYPVVIFQHPITPTDPVDAASVNKMAMLGLANTLGGAGMAVVAIDAVGAGDRSVLVHDMLDDAMELYPLLNSDVFVTRDNLRQTVVDLMQLVRVLKDCTPAACGGLEVDPDRIYFVGTSAGGLIGSLFASLAPEVKRAVLNASGAGLLDMLATSPILAAQLAPSLCAGGLLSSACCQDQPVSCTAQDLAADPGFADFKVSGQWILDPADPINFLSLLGQSVADGSKRVLVQQATGDLVFSNSSSGLLAGLLDLEEKYFKSYDPGMCGSVPGGAHSMLLSNCGAGTVAMQTDIVTFLLSTE